MDGVEHGWHYACLTVILFCAVCEAFLLCIFFFRFRCHRHHDNDGQMARRLELFSKEAIIVFFLLVISHALIDFVHIYQADSVGDEVIYGNEWHIIRGSAEIFYFIYTIELYALLIHRLYRISPSSLNRTTRITLAVAFTAICALMLWYLIDEFDTQINANVAHILGHNYTLASLLWWPMIALGMLFDIFIMLLLIRNLRKILTDNIHIEGDDDEEEELPLVDDTHGQQYVKIVAKFTVLGAVIVICNLLYGVWKLCKVFALNAASDERTNIIQNVSYVMRDIEGFIQCIALYLTFTMSEAAYKCLCCCCHDLCYHRCLVNIEHEIEARRSGYGSTQ